MEDWKDNEFIYVTDRSNAYSLLFIIIMNYKLAALQLICSLKAIKLLKYIFFQKI